MINIEIPNSVLFMGQGNMTINQYEKILSAQATYSWVLLESLEKYDIYVCSVCGRKAFKDPNLKLFLDSTDGCSTFDLITDTIDQYTIKDILT